MIEAILAVSVCKKKRCRKLYGLFYQRMAEPPPEYFSKLIISSTLTSLH